MGVVDRVRPALLRRLRIAAPARVIRLVSGPTAPPPAAGSGTWNPVPSSQVAARAAALTAVLTSSVAVGRDPVVLLLKAVPTLSSWSAGRLVADGERVRAEAVAVAALVRRPDGRVPLREFVATLRRHRPLLSEAALQQLWEHVVLLDRLAPPPAPVLDRPYAGARDVVRRRVRRWGRRARD